jgi:hypothetical protein
MASMLQKEVMMSFKIQRCNLSGVSEDDHERPGQSVYTEKPNCKPQIHTPPFLLEFCCWDFAEASILNTPCAEVQNLLLVLTTWELQTEHRGCCCQLVFVSEVRL